MENKWKWDKWQQEVLNYEGNITIRSGRQVGKSEVISAKSAKFALEHANTTTLIIAASQRQSSLLFEKVRSNIDRYQDEGKIKYKEPPTLTRIVLSNGSRIYSLPAGRTGYFIRGFTIDLLIADEAAYIPETVWTAVIPMLAVSKKMRGLGTLITISTPFGKGGFYYNTFTDKDFKAFHVSSEDCKRIPKSFLHKEKQRMTKVEYRQEYQGEFTDEWNQLFPTKLIKECMSFIEWNKETEGKEGKFYLGVDFAGYGGDENAFVICQMLGTRLKVVKCMTTERVSSTDTINRVIMLDDIWKFSRIFVDDAGLGSPMTDTLQNKLGRKVLGLNNSRKTVKDNENEEKRQKIDKEDYYNNAVQLMETKRVEIISDLQLLRSLKSVTFELTDNRRIKIFGDYTHLAEAFVRALWCIKEKGLTPYIY